jgi:hypothetical protein
MAYPLACQCSIRFRPPLMERQPLATAGDAEELSPRSLLESSSNLAPGLALLAAALHRPLY